MNDIAERLLNVQTMMNTARQFARDAEAERLLAVAIEKQRKIIEDVKREFVSGWEYRG